MPDAVAPRKLPYLRRLWDELGQVGGEHEAVVKLIIVERSAKAVLLLLLAVGLLVTGRSGLLAQWAQDAQEQLNLDVGQSLIAVLFLKLLVLIGEYRHITALALAAIAYAMLEGTEGIGLAMRRRWAEYLTVIATGLLIPFEFYEVIHQVTFFRVGALLVNLAVVGYLGYRKRLFVRV